MYDEYLWNKTGNDAELESVENALSLFRYRETEPPRISAKAAKAVEQRTEGRFWRSGLALAFAAAVAVAASGTLFLIPTDVPTNMDVAVNGVQLHSLSLAEIPPISNTTVVKDAQPKSISAFAKVRQPSRTSAQLAHRVEKKLINERPQIQLTAEEKNAYDQLMLALSITSSKLKIVKDTVSQINKPNTAIERYR